MARAKRKRKAAWAVKYGKLRWAKMSKRQQMAHVRMMSRARWLKLGQPGVKKVAS